MTCRRGLATCGCLKDSISAQNDPSLLSRASRTCRTHTVRDWESFRLTCSGHTDSPAAGTDWEWCAPWPLTSDPVALKQDRVYNELLSTPTSTLDSKHSSVDHTEKASISAAANSHIHTDSVFHNDRKCYYVYICVTNIISYQRLNWNTQLLLFTQINSHPVARVLHCRARWRHSSTSCLHQWTRSCGFHSALSINGNIRLSLININERVFVDVKSCFITLFW